MTPGEALGYEAHGICMDTKRVIKLAPDMDEDRERNTLLHELFHACWCIYGIKEEDGEERIVFTLANALTALLKDNPKLRELI